MSAQPFSPPLEGRESEESDVLAPRFGADGLLTAVVNDSSGRVLMLAHMNAEALRLTLETGEAHFWSRSRKALWKKGETSGAVLSVSEIRIDCDQDAVVLTAELPAGRGACHTGRDTCFYRRIESDGKGGYRLVKA